MEQEIRFCASADGTRIAYATYGERDGTPLVLVESWFYSQQAEWGNPQTRILLERLAEGRPMVTFDRRGKGASQREVDDVSIDSQVADQAAVVDDLGLERFDMLGYDALTSVPYAARYPDRVARLVLWAPWAQGEEITTPEDTRRTVELALSHWPAYRRMLATEGFRNGPAELQRWFSNMIRDSASPQVAAKYIEFEGSVDIRPFLPQVQAPTLVLHPRGLRHVPAAASQRVAALIPRARFVALDGDPSMVFLESARFTGIVHEFLDEERTPRRTVQRSGGSGLVTILFTDLASSTALTQRLGDAGAQELVRAHNAIVREALDASGGTEIKHTGDGIMASFPTASGAIECAITIQRAVAERNDPDLQVYIGLNAGEPVAEEQDLFGTSVQLAKRLVDHAEAGQIVVSNVVRELAAGKGFLFADIGEVVPKGFEEPVRLYEVRWQD